MASHYLQTDPAHDTLSDWSFIRIDAQADYLVAHGREDTFTADWAFQYMTDETMLTGWGRGRMVRRCFPPLAHRCHQQRGLVWGLRLGTHLEKKRKF